MAEASQAVDFYHEIGRRLDRFEAQLSATAQTVTVAQAQLIAHIAQDDDRQKQWMELREQQERREDERSRRSEEFMIRSATDRQNIRETLLTATNAIKIEVRDAAIRVLYWVVGLYAPVLVTAVAYLLRTIVPHL